MMKIRSLIQSYPLASYFVLAYLISWGGSIAFGGPQFIRREPMEFEEAANETLWWTIYAIVIWLAAAVILARYGKRLVRQPKQYELQ